MKQSKSSSLSWTLGILCAAPVHWPCPMATWGISLQDAEIAIKGSNPCVSHAPSAQLQWHRHFFPPVEFLSKHLEGGSLIYSCEL